MRGLIARPAAPAAPAVPGVPQEPGARSSCELRLEYLATGDFQHVFTRADAPDDGWVYKIPAAFGVYVPFRCFWPRNALERAMCLALGDVPHAVQRRITGRLAALAGRHGAARLRPVVAWLDRGARLAQRLGERGLAVYGRHIRVRHFARMARMLDEIARDGPAEVLLPWRVQRRARAMLVVEGRHFAYDGPVLLQRRATVFERGSSIRSFDWRELVDAQHRLWRRGVGFDSLRETLGPKSWALLDGHLRLADTSSLTRDFRTVHGRLCKEQLDRRQHKVARQLADAGDGELAEGYFRLLRRELSQRRLEQLWRADLRRAAGGAP